jgi:hypothetical protein
MRTDFNKAVGYLVVHASLSVDFQEPYIYIYRDKFYDGFLVPFFRPVGSYIAVSPRSLFY